jgi:hypothetical protein
MSDPERGERLLEAGRAVDDDEFRRLQATFDEERPPGRVPISSLEEQDAKRPNRERESLVGERIWPALAFVPEHLATLRTAEGMQLLPNTLAELRRDMARLR